MCNYYCSINEHIYDFAITYIPICCRAYVYYTYGGGVVHAWGRITLIVIQLSATYKCYYT